MLRALLLQLSIQLPDDHSDLKRLRKRYKTGIPSTSVLSICLQQLIQKFRQIFIILDALDESLRNGANM